MILDGRRIFLIEDNLENRAIAQMLLEGEGAKVAFERWGTDYLQRIRNFSPVDVILLDLMFPNGVTGYDICKNIRSVPEFSNIPIIAVSASDPSDAIAKSKSYGFNGFIRKPIDFNKFTEQIVSVLNGKAVWESY